MDAALKLKLFELICFLVQPPPVSMVFENILELIIFLVRPPIAFGLSIQDRLFDGHNDAWERVDIFQSSIRHPFEFFHATGETPESFLDMVNEVRGRICTIHVTSLENMVLMTLFWIRAYPTNRFLSAIFSIPQPSVSRALNIIWRILHAAYAPLVSWPSNQQWRDKRGKCELYNAVAAIDGTSHEIEVPQDNHRFFYSGHRHMYCIHTQVIVDMDGRFCFIRSGFPGHMNDAAQYQNLPTIGPRQELEFPNSCVIVGDKIYPNRYPIVTSFTRAQIRRLPQRDRRRAVRLNQVINTVRAVVEHGLGDLKVYKIMNSVYRHELEDISELAELCAGLVNRRLDFMNDY